MRCKRHGLDPWVRKTSWRRKWQPTPVFLAGEFHGQRNLEGYSPWVIKSQIQLSKGAPRPFVTDLCLSPYIPEAIVDIYMTFLVTKRHYISFKSRKNRCFQAHSLMLLIPRINFLRSCGWMHQYGFYANKNYNSTTPFFNINQCRWWLQPWN